jgi:hypothetical protein
VLRAVWLLQFCIDWGFERKTDQLIVETEFTLTKSGGASFGLND